MLHNTCLGYFRPQNIETAPFMGSIDIAIGLYYLLHRFEMNNKVFKHNNLFLTVNLCVGIKIDVQAYSLSINVQNLAQHHTATMSQWQCRLFELQG